MKKLFLFTFLLIMAFQLDVVGQKTPFQTRKQAKKISPSCFTVTLDQKDQAGAIWWPSKLDLTKDQSLHFNIYLGTKDKDGADGLAFVMHNDPRGIGVESDKESGARGEVGGGLYTGDHPSQPSKDPGINRSLDSRINKSVTIELDTWSNSSKDDKDDKNCKFYGGLNDPAVDHTTVYYNGDVCFPQFPPVQLHPTETNVEDGNCHAAEIRWKPGKDGQPDELTLLVAGVVRFTHKDFMKNIFGTDEVWYGFTGSTGGSSNEQTICIFDGSNKVPEAQDDYVSTPYGTAITVDVQANDADTDGDEIFTTKILVKAAHGEAIIDKNDKIIYTPGLGYAGYDKFQYEIVDINPLEVNPDKCYVNKTAAWVYINKVECPDYKLIVEKIKDNEKCDPSENEEGLAVANNGRARAYMKQGTSATEITQDLVFAWFKGTYSTPDEVIGLDTAYKGIEITNLEHGHYTVVARLKNSNECKFNVVNLFIDRVRPIPDFSIEMTKATQCDPSNGRLQVKFADPNADKDRYIYIWYEQPPNPISYESFITNLHPKQYTLIVIDKITGCQQGTSAVVESNYSIPTISTTTAPLTHCITPNGVISANVGGNTSNYDFIWSSENDPNFLTPIFTGPEHIGQAAKSFWVKAKDKATGCFLAPVKVTVDDNRQAPEFTYSHTNNTSCNPSSSANGSITVTTVDVNQSLSNYTFEFFAGNNTFSALVLPAKIDPTDKHKAVNLLPGEYTVRVTNDITGCFSTELITIEDKRDNPSIHLVSLSNQIKCSPADGSISVNIDLDGNGPGTVYSTNNYTFKWWRSTVVKENTTPDYTGSSISNLPEGDYTVLATSVNGCRASKTFKIGKPGDYPQVTVTATKSQQSCDPANPNGVLTATNTVVPGFTYTYQWYRGISTLPADAMSGYTGLVAGNLKKGDYTIKVTNNYGCVTTAHGTVAENIAAQPVINVGAIVSVPQSMCADPNPGPGHNKPNGEATVSLSVGNPANIEIRWFDGEYTESQLAGRTPNFVGTNYKYLTAGKYTVQAVDIVNNCKSAPVVIPIGINLPNITINPNVTNSPSSDCITADGRLEASAEVVGASPAHTFSYLWYEGSPDTDIPPFFTSATPLVPFDVDGKIINNIKPTRYTVVVKDLTTGCWEKKTVDLEASSPVPTVKVTAVDNSDCINPNGEIHIDHIFKDKIGNPGDIVTGASIFTEYDVYFYEGSVRPASLTPVSAANHPFTGLGSVTGSKFYTVFVKDKFGQQCESYPELVEIKNVADMKPIINFITSANQTNCDFDAPNGALSLEIKNPQGGDFTKYSYSLDGGAQVAFTANPVIITGKGFATYNIIVTNNNSNCTASASASIYDTHVDPTVPSINVTHKTTCNPNGTIAAASYDLTNFEYRWFKIVSGVATRIGAQNGDEFEATDLDSGLYQLQVLDLNTNCTSTNEVRVLDNRVLPIINIENTTFSTVCNTDYDGTATIALNPGTSYNSPADYQPLIWTFNGAPLASVSLSNSDDQGNLLPSHQFRATGLQKGVYTLTVANTLSPDCPETVTFEISELIELPKLTAIGIDLTICDPSDANINITSTTPAGLTYFKYRSVVNGVESAPLSLPLTFSPGEYTITAVNPATGCETKPVQVKIEDKTPELQFNLEELRHQTRCDSLVNQNGMIRVSVVPAGSYTYRWFKNGDVTPIATGIDLSSISNLSRGKYTVEVTLNGCVFSQTFNIRNQKNKFIPVIAKQNVTRCEAPYNGRLAASVNGGTNGYSFQWTHLETSTTYSSVEARNLPTGNYSLLVVDEETTCDTTLFVTLDFDPQPFEIMVTEDKPVTNCDMEKANGQMSVTVDGQAAGFQYDWYETANITATTPIAFTGSTVNELKAVTYTLRVTNVVTGCVKDQQVTPLHLPIQVPAPTIVTSRDVTSCASPNGYGEVTVGGYNANHIFKWYRGSALKSTPDHEGYFVDVLEIGDYLVTATDKLSGCVSAPIKVTIGDGRIYVDFDVKIKNSVCHSDNGSATITWIEPVASLRIEVSNGNETRHGDVMYDMPYGDFHVVFETMEGCVTEKDITIGADWLVYNGVSPNGDGMNDKLSIDCIELFPNNKVKIFNRAGALVYVGEGYNNDSVYFEGLGNRGIYVTGNYLPDGTYYYVVDPGDGSKPSAGFFELLR